MNKENRGVPKLRVYDDWIVVVGGCVEQAGQVLK